MLSASCITVRAVGWWMKDNKCCRNKGNSTSAVRHFLKFIFSGMRENHMLPASCITRPRFSSATEWVRDCCEEPSGHEDYHPTCSSLWDAIPCKTTRTKLVTLASRCTNVLALSINVLIFPLMFSHALEQTTLGRISHPNWWFVPMHGSLNSRRMVGTHKSCARFPIDPLFPTCVVCNESVYQLVMFLDRFPPLVANENTHCMPEPSLFFLVLCRMIIAIETMTFGVVLRHPIRFVLFGLVVVVFVVSNPCVAAKSPRGLPLP